MPHTCIGGFFTHLTHLSLGGQLKMEQLFGLTKVFLIGVDLVFGGTYMQFNEIFSLPQYTEQAICVKLTIKQCPCESIE